MEMGANGKGLDAPRKMQKSPSIPPSVPSRFISILRTVLIVSNVSQKFLSTVVLVPIFCNCANRCLFYVHYFFNEKIIYGQYHMILD